MGMATVMAEEEGLLIGGVVEVLQDTERERSTLRVILFVGGVLRRTRSLRATGQFYGIFALFLPYDTLPHVHIHNQGLLTAVSAGPHLSLLMKSDLRKLSHMHK